MRAWVMVRQILDEVGVIGEDAPKVSDKRTPVMVNGTQKVRGNATTGRRG